MVIPQAETPIKGVDLAAFAEAWSRADIDRIRPFYTDNATYLSDEEVVALQRRKQVSPYIADDVFKERLRVTEGLEMRIVGEPMQIFDKLVGFAFR